MTPDKSDHSADTKFVPETDLAQTVRVACDFVSDALQDLQKAAEVLDVSKDDSVRLKKAAAENEVEAEEVARQLLLVVARRLDGTAEKLGVTAETLEDTAAALRKKCEQT